ncbi:MAG TPA: tetratricopeptide repeat protein, partial [Caldilinea sp.]|nr:tetratricopeptide repeat protein [Caldilinea sp.]
MAIVSGCNRDEPAPTPLPAAEAPTAQLLPTFTPTPAGNGSASTAATSPEPVQPISAPAEALPLPTPTPAPVIDTPDVQSAVPAAATPAEDPLATGRRLLRYGDYVAARTALNQVATATNGDSVRRAEALYDLGRAYLGEGLYGEALATFDQLDTLLAGSGDPGQFGQKEHFLRAEALTGMGRYTDAVAAYWQFLDAYPWMGEAV